MSATLTTGAVIDDERQTDVLEKAFVPLGKTGKTAFDLTGAAKAIVELFGALGEDLLFRAAAVNEGEWRRWNGRYWQLYREIDLRRDINALLDGQISNQKMNELTRTVAIDRSRDWNAFDKAGIVTLKNYCIGVANNKLTASNTYKKAHLATFELAVSWTKQPTPHWTALIERLLPDAADRAALQELFGCCFVPPAQAQAFFVLFGQGLTGKSTIAAILRDMLGAERISAVKCSQLSTEFGLAPLVGKFVNIDSESQYIAAADEVLLKQITGGDVCQINMKHKQQFATVISARMLMICNELPKFNDKTSGTWSRMALIPFNTVIPPGKQDPTEHILERIRPEYGGILNWALKGLTRLLKKGSTRADAFTQSATATAAIAEHKLRSNPFLEWYEESVILDANHDEVRRTVYNHYAHWCKARNYLPCAERKHKEQMISNGCVDDRKQAKGNRGRVWLGVRLAQDA